MPKKISNAQIKSIISLREDEGLSFSAIGSKIGLHENSVSKVYRGNKNLNKIVPASNDEGNAKDIIVAGIGNLDAAKKAMLFIAEAINKFLYDSSTGLEMQELLQEKCGLYMEDYVNEQNEAAIAEFKQKMGLDRLPDEKLFRLASALYGVHNQNLKFRMTLPELIEKLATLFEENEDLQVKLMRLYTQKEALIGDVQSLAFEKEKLEKEIVKLQMMKEIVLSRNPTSWETLSLLIKDDIVNSPF